MRNQGARKLILACCIALVTVCVELQSFGQETAPPRDTCVLWLTLPDGATVTVDSREYGTKRELTFSGLQPGRKYESNVVVRFQNGSEDRRVVLIEGGRRLDL